MYVEPGMEFLEENMIQSFDGGLIPGDEYPIPVPPSGGVIIQGGNGIYMVEMPDGEIIWINQAGERVNGPWE